jgi:hypothetical protein
MNPKTIPQLENSPYEQLSDDSVCDKTINSIVENEQLTFQRDPYAPEPTASEL